MALFVSNEMVYSGNYGLATRSNCRDCGRTQHYDCTGEYIVPCPFNNSPAPRGRNRGGSNTQIANVVINGDSYGVSQRNTNRRNRHNVIDSDRIHRNNVIDSDTRHVHYNNIKREQRHSAALGRMNWRTTGKVKKTVKKPRPVSVIACDLGGSTKKHNWNSSNRSKYEEHFIIEEPPITPRRRTRPASTNAPHRRSRNGGNGTNIVQIMQVQNSQSNNGGTGPLARGGAGGFGLRQKVSGVPYVIRGQRQATQRVNPSGFLTFR